MKKEYTCIGLSILFLLALPLNCIQTSYTSAIASVETVDLPAEELELEPEPGGYCEDHLNNIDQGLSDIKKDLAKLKEKRRRRGAL